LEEANRKFKSSPSNDDGLDGDGGQDEVDRAAVEADVGKNAANNSLSSFKSMQLLQDVTSTVNEVCKRLKREQKQYGASNPNVKTGESASMAEMNVRVKATHDHY